MTRPVRPIALVILTACMIYPGASLLFQGLYPFVAGDYIMLFGKLGAWMDLANRFGIPPVVPLLLKAGLGTAWVFGVIGLWAGDPPIKIGKLALPGLAYPLVIAAAVGSLLYPGGAMLMSVLALIALFGFRENAQEVSA